MNQRILLITGWGGGARLLNPLKEALTRQGHAVELINIFNALDQAVLQQQAEKARNFDVIAGWSLGGQLAALLADQIYKQYAEQKILITLASNPCFVANDEWTAGMDQSVFQNFKKSFEHDATATLKKFGFMVCQGVATIKEDFAALQNLIQPQNLETLRSGLSCLGQLNTAGILKNYAGRQYHLFAQQDFLVSCKVEQNLRNFGVKFLETELIDGSHGFPVFESESISCKICHYLKKTAQTNG